MGSKTTSKKKSKKRSDASNGENGSNGSSVVTALGESTLTR